MVRETKVCDRSITTHTLFCGSFLLWKRTFFVDGGGFIMDVLVILIYLQ